MNGTILCAEAKSKLLKQKLGKVIMEWLFEGGLNYNPHYVLFPQRVFRVIYCT